MNFTGGLLRFIGEWPAELLLVREFGQFSGTHDRRRGSGTKHSVAQASIGIREALYKCGRLLRASLVHLASTVVHGSSVCSTMVNNAARGPMMIHDHS